MQISDITVITIQILQNRSDKVKLLLHFPHLIRQRDQSLQGLCLKC